ncbi:hypothetical protein PspLS_12061 [Pyricularia sp. CBS 133598]|nr:hypothetical protein PspLS_12061 [Pyricularia sp. CBS 133598]
MLPSELVSTYQQYKLDTNSVTAWLASTAKLLGYPAYLLDSSSDTASTPNPRKASGRLKGKARALPRRPPNPAAPTPISEEFRTVIDRVTVVRSKFGGQLPDYVLAKVRSVLSPFTPAVKDKDRQSDAAGLANPFAGLGVYERSQELLNLSDVARPGPRQSDNSTYEARPESSFEEEIFALDALINDLVGNWPVKDELYQGVEELAQTKMVLFYAAFAAQIFLDITYQLGEYFHSKLIIKTWTAAHTKYYAKFRKALYGSVKTLLRTVQNRLLERMGVPASTTPWHLIFRMFPALTGFMFFHSRVVYCDAGRAVADT